jgi:hypothetical protein
MDCRPLASQYNNPHILCVRPSSTAGASQRLIAAELGVQQPTISSLFQKITISTLKKRGPRRLYKRATNARTDRLIVRTALKARRMSLKALTSEVNLGVSYKTIQRRLKAAGIRKRVARTKPFLSSKSDLGQRCKVISTKGWRNGVPTLIYVSDDPFVGVCVLGLIRIGVVVVEIGGVRRSPPV